MIKLPMQFTMADCGCGGAYPPNPCVPFSPVAAGVGICDNRLLQLASLSNLKLLGVQSGAACMAFLAPHESGGALVWIGADGSVYANRTPALRLPWINAPTGDVFPATGTWNVMMGSSSGAADEAWQFLKPPSSGEYLILADNGLFRYIDAGEIPGLTTVCESQTGSTLINLIGCSNTTPEEQDPTWVLRKLTAINGRVVTGYIPDTGTPGFRELPSDVYLQHALGRFPVLECSTLKFTNDLGVAQTIAQGNLAVQTDLQLMCMSPTTGFVYRIPTPTYQQGTPVVSNDGFTAGASFANLPGSHGKITATTNYPTVRVCANINIAENKQLQYALYRDGVELFIYQYSNGRDEFINWIDTSVPVGVSHTWEVRVKADEADVDLSVVAQMRWSQMNIETLLK